MSRVIADGLSDKALALISSSIDGIDSLGFDAAGAADTAVSDHVAETDPHTQYAGLDGGANANFTTMPQVGGDPIVESGSNADGEWTRWSDGTQVEFTTIQEDLPTAIDSAGDISNFDMARSSPLNWSWNGASTKAHGRSAGGGGNRCDVSIAGRLTENVKVFRPIGLLTTSTGTTGIACKHIVISLMKVSRWT